MADDELVINIDDENTDIQTGDKNDAVEDLKSQFAKLEAETKAERQRAEAAERRAAQAAQDAGRWQQEAHTAQATVADRELDTVVSGIAQAQAEADAAAAAFAAAAEAGDFKAQAEANMRIARAASKLGRLDEAKADIEVRRADPAQQRRDNGRGDAEVRGRPAPAGDPVEAFIATRHPSTQAWLRSHPDEARALMDPGSRRGQKINAAHSDAIAEGITPDTPEYFSHVERFIGLTKKDSINGATNGSGERQRRSSPPAAPVSGASGAGTGAVGGTQVRLSKGEVAAATDGTIVWNRGSPHPKTGQPIKEGDPLIGEPIGTREMARRQLAIKRSRPGYYENGDAE